MKKTLLLLGLSFLIWTDKGYAQISTLYSNTFNDEVGLTFDHINNRTWKQTLTAPLYWSPTLFGSVGFETAADGYMMFHSSIGAYDGLPNDATFSFTVDCSDATETILGFQQHFVKYQNDITSIVVDNGTDSETHVLNTNLTIDTYTANPDDVLLDISSIADGKANVTITFRYQGNYDYWWLIDDVFVEGNTGATALPIPNANLFCLAISTISEGTSCNGTKDIPVHVSLDNKPNGNTIVDLALSGTAELGTDYSINASSLTFTTDNWDIPQVIILGIKEDAVLESDETIVIDILNVSGSNAAIGTNGAISLTIVDDERFFVPPTHTIYSNTFANTDDLSLNYINNTPWVQTTSNPLNWSNSYFGLLGFTTANDGYMLLDSDGTGNDGVCEDASFSFQMDCSDANSAVLKFQQHFAKFENDITTVIVDNGTNSETYVLNSTLGMNEHTTNPDDVSLDISAIADAESNVKVTFRYQGDYDYWWMVDDVLVESASNTTIQTSTNMHAGYVENDLGAGSIVHFYDDVTGGLMCTIDNSASSHDYGCTRVEIDRSGASAEGFMNADSNSYMFSKSLKISPSMNTDSDPNGYTITLYYSEAEVSGWEAATGQSRASVQMHKVNGDHHISEVTEGNPDGLSITSGNAVCTPFGIAHAFTASFTNGFSGFGLGVPSSSLPVELVEFQARKKEKTSLLKWRTASEKENKGFHIEKSINGIDFETIGWITGKGTTAEMQWYQFVDDHPFFGENYYRLKQEDFDGTTSYSEIKMVLFEIDFTISVYPNPSRIGQFTFIELFSESRQKVNIDLYDTQGKQITSFSQILEKGKNKISLAQETLQAGMYMVSVSHNQGTSNTKLSIIQ